MPVKQSLELVAVVGLNGMDAKREFFEKIVDKIDGIFLSMTVINFERSCPGCVINRRILETSDFLAVFEECQELYIDLHTMAWNLLFIAFEGLN